MLLTQGIILINTHKTHWQKHKLQKRVVKNKSPILTLITETKLEYILIKVWDSIQSEIQIIP